MDNVLEVRDLTRMAIKEVIPISVLIEVCHTCNENCIHCYLADHTRRGMTTGQYEMLFDQLVDAGTFFVILTGGEPFMRRDFMEIVRMARRRRISVTIFTNGTLITEQLARELASLWVQEVHISVYGADASIHDGITRVPGSFKKSMTAVDLLKKNGITVRFKSPLMSRTADGISELKALAESKDVDLQFTAVITAMNDGNMATTNLRLTDAQLKDLLLDEKIDSHTSQAIERPSTCDCVPCDTVYNGGAIDPFGNVFPCNQLQVCGGNVLEQSFGDIWSNSFAFRNLREMRVDGLDDCDGCSLFLQCTRCPGLALLEDGDIRGCSSAAKRIAKIRRSLGTYPLQNHIFSKI